MKKKPNPNKLKTNKQTNQPKHTPYQTEEQSINKWILPVFSGTGIILLSLCEILKFKRPFNNSSWLITYCGHQDTHTAVQCCNHTGFHSAIWLIPAWTSILCFSQTPFRASGFPLSPKMFHSASNSREGVWELGWEGSNHNTLDWFFFLQHLIWPLPKAKYWLHGSLLQSGKIVLLENLSSSRLQFSSLRFQLCRKISEAIRFLPSMPYLSAWIQ